MAPQRRALKVRVHYWAAASLLKSVLRDALSSAAGYSIADYFHGATGPFNDSASNPLLTYESNHQ
jgi:hypothetical protein